MAILVNYWLNRFPRIPYCTLFARVCFGNRFSTTGRRHNTGGVAARMATLGKSGLYLRLEFVVPARRVAADAFRLQKILPQRARASPESASEHPNAAANAGGLREPSSYSSNSARIMLSSMSENILNPCLTHTALISRFSGSMLETTSFSFSSRANSIRRR